MPISKRKNGERRRNNTRRLKKLSNKKDEEGHQFAEDEDKKKEKNNKDKTKKKKKECRILLPDIVNIVETSFLSCLIQVFAACDLLEHIMHNPNYFTENAIITLNLIYEVVQMIRDNKTIKNFIISRNSI